MISPFAGLFYSVLTAFLLEIAGYPDSPWLSAFFPPYVVVPLDNFFLRFVRTVALLVVIVVYGIVIAVFSWAKC